MRRIRPDFAPHFVEVFGISAKVWVDWERADEGPSRRPITAAWKVSATDWQIIQYQRAFNTRVTSRASYYGEPGAAQTRTVTYTYTNNVDVIGVSGPGEENYTRTYNASRQVVSNFNAIGEAMEILAVVAAIAKLRQFRS